MKLLKWVVINGLFLVFLYYGFVEGIDNAENLALFFAWVNILCSLFMTQDDMVKKMQEVGRTVSKEVNVAYDLTVLCVFIWYGAWITGSFWLIGLIMQEAGWEKVKELEQ